MNSPKQYNLDELAAMVEATKNTLDYDNGQLDEARQDFENLIAAHAGDDDLAEAQEYIAQREANAKISDARYRGALADQVNGKAQAKADTGNAASAQADALLAEIQTLMDEAGELSERVEELAIRISELTEQASEHRRIAVAHGVSVAYAPRLNPPDLAKAHAAFSRIAATGGYIWRPM